MVTFPTPDRLLYVLLLLVAVIPLGGFVLVFLLLRLTTKVEVVQQKTEDTHREVNSQMAEFRRLVTQEAHNLVTRQIAAVRREGVEEGRLLATEEAAARKKP